MGTNMIPDSWSSMNLNITSELPTNETDIKSVEYLLSESNRFLDFDNTHIPSEAYNENVIVPVHATINCPTLSPLPHAQSSKNMFEINFSTYNSFTTSTSRTDSSSSWVDMSMNVVPDGSSLSDKSYPFAGNVNEGSEVVGTDREARVLRYKEKRKNRKFEKTVRYASRKAYAEIRPRIKGRFAKRSKF